MRVMPVTNEIPELATAKFFEDIDARKSVNVFNLNRGSIGYLCKMDPAEIQSARHKSKQIKFARKYE